LDGSVDEGELVLDVEGEDGADDGVDVAEEGDCAGDVGDVSGYDGEATVSECLDFWLVGRGGADKAGDALFL
jgi:hypothetical protein